MINTYIKKERSQINNLILHLKELDKEEQTKPKVSIKKDIIKIRAEIKTIETRKREIKTIETKKISKPKSQFFEKINKIDKYLCSLNEGGRRLK